MMCLDGLRVLDLSIYIPGPFATLMLSDLGAEVVKIEAPAGDPLRGQPPFDSDGVSPFYKLLNRNKQVVTLDLKSEAGKAALEELVRGADVLLESFRPGVLERLGFGAARLREINPRLVHCAMSGYGQTGPFRLRSGHDLTYIALSGGLALTGPRERPMMNFPPLADHAGAMQALVAILAALVRRGVTGQGGSIDVSLFEAALAWQYMPLTLGRRPGEAVTREGDLLNGAAAWYRIYRTKDGRFAAFAPMEEKFWAAFCKAVERPDLLPRHADPFPQTALIAELEEIFAGRSLQEWDDLLGPADCCFEPVIDPADVPDHPHVRERGLVKVADGPDPFAEILLPALFDSQPPPPRRPMEKVAVETVLAAWGKPSVPGGLPRDSRRES
ncbi:CaiB/BaiF CoA-transferase family protein [Telmatospirillum sp. J64-1]|uniref:CaiB/BaiF CoA transferase family protein n=1 Tax=Telmatospirillum sp. J64-1 TaxID=2502183 RepID=UPI00115F5449|nr:CoA transferase [Telmatospirillum sp. J64-1]